VRSSWLGGKEEVGSRASKKSVFIVNSKDIDDCQNANYNRHMFKKRNADKKVNLIQDLE
jgi:hypothetical protein